MPKTNYNNKETVQQTFKCSLMHLQFIEFGTAVGSTTFETKSSYCRVARQGLPCYTAVAARLRFKRRATAVLKSNLIRSIEFGTAVARHLKRAQGRFLVGFFLTRFPVKVRKLHYFVI